MRWLVVGISMCVIPSGASAASTALTIAGKAPTVPASPAPLAPIGLSRRAYGDATTQFLRAVKSARPPTIDALAKYPLPAVRPRD